MDGHGSTGGDEGLNWFVAGLFIFAQLAGGGIVALPTAIIQSGIYTGMLLHLLLTVMAASTSIMLGKCWLILRRKWPATYVDRHCLDPYPEMCERAVGPKFRTFASINVQLNQMGIAIVYLLLSAKNIQHFLKAFFGINISFCLLILVLALVLFPFTLLKSPEDFWWVAVAAALTITLATILICIGSVLDAPKCFPESIATTPQFHVRNHFLAMGTILFNYGGHPGFPTIQVDMKRPEDFTKSSIVAFSVLALLYLSPCLLGSLVYGNSLRESIMNSMQHVWIQHAASFLITGHAILTAIIVINPINQIAEKKFNVPSEFCLQRVLVRGGVFLICVFVAESVPTFGPLLDLFGGSTESSTALIFPPICYLFLKASEAKAAFKERQKKATKTAGLEFYNSPLYSMPMEEQQATISDVLTKSDRKVLFFCIFIMAFGLLGGGAATFSAIRELTYTHFVPPCYVSLFMPNDDSPTSTTSMGTINCCGPWQNISIHGSPSQFCSAPELNFYD